MNSFIASVLILSLTGCAAALLLSAASFLLPPKRHSAQEGADGSASPGSHAAARSGSGRSAASGKDAQPAGKDVADGQPDGQKKKSSPRSSGSKAPRGAAKISSRSGKGSDKEKKSR